LLRLVDSGGAEAVKKIPGSIAHTSPPGQQRIFRRRSHSAGEKLARTVYFMHKISIRSKSVAEHLADLDPLMKGQTRWRNFCAVLRQHKQCEYLV